MKTKKGAKVVGYIFLTIGVASLLSNIFIISQQPNTNNDIVILLSNSGGTILWLMFGGVLLWFSGGLRLK